MSTPPKKSSLSRRFTDLIGQKQPRRPSSGSDTKEGTITPPLQTITPSASSSPLSVQSGTSYSSPQSPRFTFDEQHRLPVTFLPFVATDSSFLKLDMFGIEQSTSQEFDFTSTSDSSNWFGLHDESQSSAFEMPSPAASGTTKARTPKTMTIGWVCEDGFKPIGQFD